MRTAISAIMFLVLACKSFSQVNDTIIYETKYSNNPWQLFGREILTYDDNCNVITDVGESRDVDSHSWINLYSHTNKYDASGNLAVSVLKSWDKKTNSFINSNRDLFDYDGSRVTRTSQSWSKSKNDWLNETRSVFDLNKDGSTTFLKLQYYVGDAWEDVARDFFVYGNNNIQVRGKEQENINGIWVNSIKTVENLFNNDSKGKAVTSIWNGVTKNWEEVARDFILYLPGTDKIEEQISQEHLDNKWENSRKTVVTYNKDNLVVFDAIRSWDSKSKSWVSLFRDFHDYYPNGATHHSQSDYWDEESKKWIDSYRMTLTNNGCRLIANFTTGNTNNSQRSEKSNNMSAPGISINTMKSDGHKLIYDFPSIINPANKSVIPVQMTLTTQKPEKIAATTNENIIEKKQPNFLIFPNPARKYFYVGLNTVGKSAMLKITDLAGRAVIQTQLKNNNEKVDISNIPKGLYIVSVIAGKEVLSKKIVVE